MTPLEYLTKYCRVSVRRQIQFKRIFNRYREADHYLEQNFLHSSIKDLHKENFTKSNYENLVDLIDLNGRNYRFGFEQFSSVLALSERLLCNAVLMRNDDDRIQLRKDPIELCDFDGLTRKFDGLRIPEKIKQLLRSL